VAPGSLPGTVVTAVLTDMGGMGMMGGNASSSMEMRLRATPSSVPAGKVILVAENVGTRTHELLVLPLAAGAVAGQRQPSSDGTVDESASLGEASKSCAAGAGEGITADTEGWVTLDLPPGRYELICNLPNHYAAGMYQELIVS
jgi:uncharacterized cupredoxin-like copper-binding protein